MSKSVLTGRIRLVGGLNNVGFSSDLAVIIDKRKVTRFFSLGLSLKDAS